MGIQTSLDAVVQADRIVDSMRLADDLAFEAGRDGGVRTLRVLGAAVQSDDQVVAIAATHALAEVFDMQADLALSELLSSDRPYLREHAAWALGSRLPRFDTIGRLIGQVAAGGFGGMLAQRTLEQWSSASPEHIAIGLEGALLGLDDPGARFRLVESLGLVRGRIASRPLLRIATDPAEDETVRVSAVSALGQRRGDAAIEKALRSLAEGDGFLADVARLAVVDLSPDLSTEYGFGAEPRDGLTIAQLFLNADIDAELSQAGSGDNGGIATLLVRLGDALVAGPVARVLTLSRGTAASALESVSEVGLSRAGHVYGRIPLLRGPVESANAWPLRVTARRGIRRMLRAAGGVDMLHLRMADVGSLAAFDVARELDIPVVFTVAPDPHAVINSLDLAGRLTRSNFGEADLVDHFWFRSRLVQQLAANSAHTVLFPRPQLQRDMRELVGIDITAHPERHTIVPEGIDLDVVDRAVAEAADHAAGRPATPALAELATLLEGLPPERRELPLLVSVGRFHRVKGMASIVEAWAGGPLRETANLLLIGGNLDRPSADEREQLGLMDAIIPADDRLAHGLVLSGHRPNDTVARWVAAARFGLPGRAAPRGAYVCGSLKEEFGIALLEAMATGLLVVAPDGGGPATYVQQGVTGFLAPTWDVRQLRSAMETALAAAQSETTDERAAASRATVEASFTIQSMARSLSEVYDGVHREERERGDWLVPLP
ncbi:glycosyltransferase [Galbitalea soli]|uniref:D-inositol 3-phosphate glycosyltransferase n=1 Tax=Galbitalea soli TaxID=1268042 RepID=A0A7C9PNQ3_9MICO|nr:glycosyltransferase [Galbitalea soli]NEM91812.1 glycosyltransferase family 1 protein [Galbitalea soli]NYJ29355.1 glycosyltransferase involved in cell wall biosynthesis [Galbitalea soli]